MEPANHLTVLRRYWRLLLACTLAALAIGWLLTPTGNAVDNAKWQCKVAITPVAGGDTVRADQVLSYATGSDVTAAAAKRLGVTDLQGLIARRTVTASSPQMLVFTVTGPTQQNCKDVAMAFVTETITGYGTESVKSAGDTIKRLRVQADEQQQAVNDLQNQFSHTPAGQQPALQPQLQAAAAALTKTLTDINNLQNYTQTDAIQQWGSIDAHEAAGSLLSSPSRGLRLGLAVALGLGLGMVAALMLSRMDTKLRTRNSTEEAFNLPVIGEIPVLARRLRRLHRPLVAARPSDPAAEAYRSLRSTLLLTGPASLSGQLRDSSRPEPTGAELISRRLANPAPVILVASGRSGDGRTITVANLAAALAETGRSVLVLDCDFRNPQLHAHFGLGDGPGMAELLGGERLAELDDLIRPTGIEGLSLISGGNTTAYPAALVLRAGEVLRRARRHADLVLIDSSPLLHANDAYDLVQHADAVLVTVKAGNVTPEQADRVSELLSRTGVPVVGVALLGSLTPGGRRSHTANGGGRRADAAGRALPTLGNRVLLAPAGGPGSPNSPSPNSPSQNSQTPHGRQPDENGAEPPATSWARGGEAGLAREVEER